MESPRTERRPIVIHCVEDDPEIAAMLRLWVADNPIHPFEFDHFLTLNEALNALRLPETGRRDADRPAIVLLDLRLPDSAGLRTLEALQAGAPDLPIVVLTSDGQPEVQIGAIERGAVHFIVKWRMQSREDLGIALVQGFARHQANQRWKQAVRSARESAAKGLADGAEREKSRKDYLAMIGHDLKNPLAAIDGFADLLLDAVPDGAPRDAVESISRSAEYAMDLARDIVDESRLESGAIQPELEVIDLRHQLATIVGRLDGMAKSADVTIALTNPLTTPPLRTDPALLDRVISNILGNAIRHSPSGTKVDVGVVCFDHWVQVFVEDRGPGIEPSVRARLFERYASSKGGGGSGLGLFIAKSFVELLGGEVSCSERDGGGTTFVIGFPHLGG